MPWLYEDPNDPEITEFADRALTVPIEEGVILRRDAQGVCYTNVPHFCIHHSPDGFEWGYGGSGPADLALNLVEYLLLRQGYNGSRMTLHKGSCFRLALQLHQSCKQHFIADIPKAGGHILLSDLHVWLTNTTQADRQAGQEEPETV